MGKFIRKVFNLYPGEEKNALLFSILAFFWAIGAYCGVTLSDGMFLEHVGAKELPKAYLLTALTLFGLALIIIYAFNHFNAFKLYLATLSLGIIGFLATFFYLTIFKEHSIHFWLFFKVFCNMLMVILSTSYWLFLDQYFNLQNAKRFYSLFNSSIFLGNAIGGAFLALFINHLGMKGISIFIITLFFTTGLWLTYLNRSIKPFLDDTIEGNTTPEKTPLKILIKGFLASKFTLLIMMFYFLIQLINIVCEYTYMQSFDLYFDRTPKDVNSNSLTVFLGITTSLIALGNMLFGLTSYSRMVSRFGIHNIVGISPIFFFFTFTGWQFSDALLLAILGLVVVEGISYAIDENNSNLLLNSVPPKLKNKARVLIDSFFEPLGMLVSAIIFLLFTISSKEIGLYLTLVSLLFVLLIRNEYGKAVLKNLLQNAIHFEKKTKEWFFAMNKKDLSLSKIHLLHHFKQKEEEEKLFAFELLLELNDMKLLTRVLGEASSLSVKGKIKIIELLETSSFVKEPTVLQWLYAQSQKTHQLQLKGAIYFYLAKLGLLNPQKVESENYNQDLYLKGSYILSLYQKDPELSLKHINELIQSTKIEEINMGLSILGGTKDYHTSSIIIPFLQHPDPFISIRASEAFYQVASKETLQYSKDIIQLIENSTYSAFRINCIKALGKMQEPILVSGLILASLHLRANEKRLIEECLCSFGKRAIPFLLDILKDKTQADRVRLLGGKTLGLISITDLRLNLLEILTSEIERAYFYLYHSFCLPTSFEGNSLSLIKEALYSDYESCIDFFIQLLAISGNIENSEILSHGLHSKNPKLRATAIETLERTCDSKIFRLLKPLIDERPMEEKLKTYKKRKLKEVDVEELLEVLENTPTKTNIAIALTLKALVNPLSTIQHPDFYEKLELN